MVKRIEKVNIFRKMGKNEGDKTKMKLKRLYF
jgi:hypothetical protein